ncbi:MAG: phosphoenolpyruvate--protein phosphotransferase [Oscillospiraceae bacterium]|nr:phosphoenolpyruvate--protein phosphotransferase [Oscillospiraceae bacterium]
MKRGFGQCVLAGTAAGPVVVWRRRTAVPSLPCGDPAAEQLKFENARNTARQQLQVLFDEAAKSVGKEQAAIMEVQMLMLDDLDYLEAVAAAIASGASAADAAMAAGEEFASFFAAMDDSYMNARAADVRDMAGRIHDVLCGGGNGRLPEGEFLLAAEDLAPSETIQLPTDRILGIVTRQGSASSHTAILCRTLNIPLIIQADLSLDDAAQARILAIDSEKWYLDPDEQTLDLLREKQAGAAGERATLEAYRGRESVTKSGRRIALCANIGNPQEARIAAGCDAEGVGLMRSEFLYLGRNRLPTEEELFEAYKEVIEIMDGKGVVIRTLDIGADKQAEYLGLDPEENPALGLRGLRLCLEREDIFRPQLRAIYRASTLGDIQVIFPMVTSAWELHKARQICREVRSELLAEGIEAKDIPIGIMIETPAAAIQAAELAKEADFFSVGTNDLTQYTLAVDRQNAGLARFHDPYHPALLALLEHIAHAANDAGIWCGICGELGADPAMTETFLKMGYTELSMAPGCILQIRKIVCESEVSI